MRHRTLVRAHGKLVSLGEVISVIVLLAGACQSMPLEVDVAHVDPVFAEYKRIGIISVLDQESENMFIALYASAFANQQVFERRYLARLIGEQDLLPGRLDDETRARLGEIAGLEAVIVPVVSVESFSIRIIDVETGRILGTAHVASPTPYRLGQPTDYRLRRSVALLKEAAGL